MELRTCSLRLALTLLVLTVLGCGDSKREQRDAGPRGGVADAGGEDGGRPGDDAGRTDARVAEADSGRNGQRAEAGAADAGAGDAGQQVIADAGTRSLRAQVCGDRTDWPAPLPPPDQRTAQAVGSASFGFLEGPVWIQQQGVLLFSDMSFSGGDAQGPPARIRRLTPPSTFDVFAESSNGNGLALLPDGSAVLAATHDNQGLSLFQLTSATRTPIAVRVDGKHFNSPNDLAVRSDGMVYFTDPDWQLGARDSETDITGVYRVFYSPFDARPVHTATLIEGTLTDPNGIALSPDERTLYIGSAGNEIWKYEVANDGSVGNRTKFADTGASDGLTVDCAGNLYATSGAVEVFAPDGTKLGEITLAAEPTNAAFGGADRKTLYITAGARLYAIGLNVPGFPY